MTKANVLKIIFAGTPEFAATALKALLAAGFDVPLVLSQPDRPAGRGMKLHASAVKQVALEHGIAVAQPRSLRLDGKYADDAAAAQAAIAAAGADVMVVAAYGLILPQWTLDAPRLGCLNIHGSLLPRWRGAAPIHRAIEAGDLETGITIMQMDAGLDTGDMLLTERMAIDPQDSTATLHDKLAQLGGRMLVQALQRLQTGAADALPATKQPTQGISYAHKIDKSESVVDWTQSAVQIERRMRAFDPFPGCSSNILGESVKLWRSEIDSKLSRNDGDIVQKNLKNCGEIMHISPQGITVATGQGAVRLTQLQKAGGKRLPAADFLRGFPLQVGMRFA